MNPTQPFTQFRQRTGRLFLAILIAAFIILIAQSRRFASSLWVVVEFGFIVWQEPINRMLDSLLIWAVISGILLVANTLSVPAEPDLKKILPGSLVSFGIGFAYPYLLVAVLSIAVYIPLGIFSFIFPDAVVFTSFGFAFLCAAYAVFTWLALDTPAYLMDIIREAPAYFKLLGVLLGALLAVQAALMLISAFRILIVASVWKTQLPAFGLAFGGTLLVAILANLQILREGGFVLRSLVVGIVFILSIVTGNLSERFFQWGEYGSAAAAALIGAPMYTLLMDRILKNLAGAVVFMIGLVGGLGAGLLVASLAGLQVLALELPGILCGAGLALGFGVAFAFLLGPRLGLLMEKALNLSPYAGRLVSMGLVLGIALGVLIGGFIHE